MGRAQFYQMFPFAIDEMNEPLRNEEKENSKLPVPRKTSAQDFAALYA